MNTLEHATNILNIENNKSKHMHTRHVGEKSFEISATDPLENIGNHFPPGKVEVVFATVSRPATLALHTDARISNSKSFFEHA